MLKRFFISLLGTVAGIWISCILLFFGLIMLLAALGANDSPEGIKKHSILCVNLDGEIEERASQTSLQDIIRGDISSSSDLRTLIDALEKAAEDERIDGVVLNCKGASMGFATSQELSEAISKFKEKSNKWVYAYADTYAQGDYLLAVDADSIYINPMGSVDIHGIASQIPFFKGLLDKVGVKMQIVKVGTFKSAVEPFILTSASDPSRLQTQTFVDSIWAYMSANVAEKRKLTPEKVTELASEFYGARTATDALEAGLVDHLAYRRIFDNKLRDLTETSYDDDLPYVTPEQLVGESETDAAAVFMTALKNQKEGKKEDMKRGHSQHIAVLYATGDITDDSGDGIVGSTMVPQILKLADDEKVEGLILRVNSGGGSAFASEQIWEALQYFKSKGKPFYVSMGDYAASGGYYISCGADKIFADFTTLTGSIGVFGMIPDASELITDKLGVNFSVIESNPNAMPINLMSAMTPDQYNAMQKSVEEIYETFVGRVAAGRDMTPEKVKEIAEGRVWVGASAVQLGLVDELGSLVSTIEAMKKAYFTPEIKVVYYPEVSDDFWTILARSGALDTSLSALAEMNKMPELDASSREILEYVARLRSQAPVQARMELMYLK